MQLELPAHSCWHVSSLPDCAFASLAITATASPARTKPASIFCVSMIAFLLGAFFHSPSTRDTRGGRSFVAPSWKKVLEVHKGTKGQVKGNRESYDELRNRQATAPDAGRAASWPRRRRREAWRGSFAGWL
jgi:hypothetical protein